MSTTQIAQVCHEVNRAYCEAIGDSSLKKWEETSEQLRQSCIKGVEFALANLNATPEEQHAAWMEQRLKDGWVLGEVKNEEAKTHPNLKPYVQLPVAQITKDHLFRAVVMNLKPFLSESDSTGDKADTANESSSTQEGSQYASSFAGALAALRDGYAVTRDGWNGKNMFVVKQIPATIGLDIIPKMQSLPQSAKDLLLGRHQEIHYTNQMLIINAYGKADSWVPSVSDLFAEDWRVVNK